MIDHFPAEIQQRPGGGEPVEQERWQRGGEDVGVRLTLNSEHELYRWGPITQAPSLLDGDGGFPRTLTDVWDHADLDEVRRESMLDPLTKIYNRKSFDEGLLRATAEADEHKSPLCLMLVDIDHFKRFNDDYGHQTGDEVLCKIAEIARGQIRAEDLVGRVGGEEFVCILSGVGGREARALAERVCRAIAQGTERASCPKATISVGLALLRAGDSVETLLRRADAALYEAKENGRNQVRRAA